MNKIPVRFRSGTLPRFTYLSFLSSFLSSETVPTPVPGVFQCPLDPDSPFNRSPEWTLSRPGYLKYWSRTRSRYTQRVENTRDVRSHFDELVPLDCTEDTVGPLIFFSDTDTNPFFLLGIGYLHDGPSGHRCYLVKPPSCRTLL